MMHDILIIYIRWWDHIKKKVGIFQIYTQSGELHASQKLSNSIDSNVWLLMTIPAIVQLFKVYISEMLKN
jgi:hypothetical protein